MGNIGSLPNSHLVIHVKTGDRKGAGTDATIKCKLYDTAGVFTDELKLARFWHNDHERGQVMEFAVPGSFVPVGFGEVAKLELWRDAFGFGDSWYLDLIYVEDTNTGKKYYFPAQRWIKANTRYVMKHYDTCLPQFDEEPRNRRLELEHKKSVYRYAINSPGMPAQVERLPEDETFSDSYKWDIVSNKIKFIKDRKLISVSSGVLAQWESWEDLRRLYKYSMDMPLGAKHWNNDLWFGTQRLQGCNPVLIRLCKQIPNNLTLDLKRAEAILDGTPVSEAVAQSRIFIVDLKILDNLACKDNRPLCAPIALFHLDRKGNFLPLAIQLKQHPSPTNPVFYPTDNPYAWLLAKMWYNNADATFHQSCTHLGFTHLMMEGVAVCSHRNLSPSHPIFKLLAPHFLFLLAINTRGLQKLINPGGWVDKTTTVGCSGMFQLIARGVLQWRLDRDAIPAKDCAHRGVIDKTVLPYYPYRDDAIAIFEAIQDYVTVIVKDVYDTTEKIANDWELQQWVAELAKDKDVGGVGIVGIPGNGNFTSPEQIITTLAAIISSCSVAHAAANFNQYDEYAFPPNYPAFLSGEIPTQKEGYTDRDVLLQLPPKSVTLDTMVVTRLLSSKGTNSLGDFEVQYLYDPISVEAAKKLRQRLIVISKSIRERNAQSTTKFPYPWLDPEIVPNSISI
ncbi:allene oxide synthase-lipoxygenase protein-like [Paramacrobiotus metropolitanus]|uniref:allene oxide synthase-lipoxygenase protein-like n=1 Tax=Paramacrobiotus metropolitanus TaxID=2943436 RepID=UPI002445E8D1|nr:allene oxide synthase-lipoxygenase protein-like [Paramacrobiotus metropolitanus]